MAYKDFPILGALINSDTPIQRDKPPVFIGLIHV
jgi:hypothetical protein